MMKILKLIVMVIVMNVLLIPNVQAYTKTDILNLVDDVEICSRETRAIFNGFVTSYTRILNERNVSQKNLDIIYQKIEIVINKLKINDICDIDQKTEISESLKEELLSIFESTNDLLLKSPLINTSGNNNKNEVTDSKVVTDTANNSIKIYENGILTNVIELEEKLNYVGINYILKIWIIISFLLTLISIILLVKNKSKNNIIYLSCTYVFGFILVILITFSRPISLFLDTVTLMSVKENNNIKEVVVDGKNIISYPSYGTKYGVININNQEEDLYFGDDAKTLKKGVGQSNSSFLPGENKKTILSGHNTGVFAELFNVAKKDKITIDTMYASFIYEIKDIKIVNSDDTSILSSKNDLIMYTCYPKKNIYGNKRLVILANLIESEWITE